MSKRTEFHQNLRLKVGMTVSGQQKFSRKIILYVSWYNFLCSLRSLENILLEQMQISANTNVSFE